MPEISKTADQALTVLIEVSERGPLSPAQLARTLGFNRTVVHRLLSTLHQRGFVTREGNGYGPGTLLVRLAEHVQPQLRVHGRAAMNTLVSEVGETVVMHVPDGDEAVVLEQVVASTNVVRVEHEIGSRHSLVAGASGRALLAFMDEGAVKRVLRRAEHGDTVRRQLDGVRKLGYALSHDELQQGVHGLAVPVMGAAGTAVASMAILAPTTRAVNLVEYVDPLAAAASDLSRRLLDSPSQAAA
jgi:IclR family transcriptional regulator, KDG regulon repressor